MNVPLTQTSLRASPYLFQNGWFLVILPTLCARSTLSQSYQLLVPPLALPSFLLSHTLASGTFVDVCEYGTIFLYSFIIQRLFGSNKADRCVLDTPRVIYQMRQKSQMEPLARSMLTLFFYILFLSFFFWVSVIRR
jgi:hypothetical protein